MATTKHTCTVTGKALPFGRLAPRGDCPRCDERHDGAPPVTFAGFDRAKAQREAEEAERRFRERNRMAGLCSCGKPRGHAVVCTYGES